LFEDWTRGAHPDLLSFVPCTYKFRIVARDLNFVLLANDYNWISSTTENAHISAWGKRYLLSFDLPFIDFLPETVPIVYKIEGFAVEVRLSLPETSTMFYVLRELHSRLKLVDRSGRPQTTMPFHIHTETLPGNQDNGRPIQRHWIDVAWAPRVTLRIGYVYHPSPWASEYWRFLPAHMRLPIPVAKASARLSGRIVHGMRQPRRRGRKHGHKAPAVTPLIRTHSDSSSQSELEELALRGLRPEGSQTQGPTEDDLMKSDFDGSYFAPDTVDFHMHVGHAQLCFYGTLLRHFIHLKENYFGCYQRPVDFAGPPMSAEEYQSHLDGFSLLPLTDAPNASVKRSKVKRIIDPRECRPILVRISLEFHNIQAHLPTHGCSPTTPCPTAFLDCIGFEMDKRWHETKIQLMFSPILLCTYDQCKVSSNDYYVLFRLLLHSHWRLPTRINYFHELLHFLHLDQSIFVFSCFVVVIKQSRSRSSKCFCR
uniref:Fmp27_GFWDK domain-containing protein n=1 Tax=Echinostoma caproni TaxID=27848 RepID=A0A183AUG1_9TREM